MANDLALLKSTIASELHRSDLTTQIANAVTQSINKYRSRRFEFNEQQATFNTIANQQTLGSGDPSFPADVGQVDTVRITVGSRFVTLSPRTFAEVERMTLTTNDIGPPGVFAWYLDKLWFYLIPDQAYSVRLSYKQRKSAPSGDSDATTIWTQPAQCEPLIRACAKKIVARDYMRNYTLSQACEQAETEALAVLLNESIELQDQGPLQDNW